MCQGGNKRYPDGCGGKPENAPECCPEKIRRSPEWFRTSKRMAYFRQALDTLRRVGVRPGIVELVKTVGESDIADGMGVVVEGIAEVPKSWFDEGSKILRTDWGCRITPSESEGILTEAARIRSGERNADYGDAVESFEIIARVANAITGLELTPAQCCKVMLAVKLTRERYNHKRDNLVDMCGYADILNLIEEQPINDKKR